MTAHSDALFCCFYPGLTGGEALAQLLFGEAAPAGRLRYPCRIMWDSCRCTTTIRIPTGAWIITTPGSAPRSPLAAGLTYTTFSYCLLAAPADAEAEKVETLTVSASITNTGLRAASAVPQLYLHRAQGVVTSRVRALCDFQKLCLAPGETQTVTLSIPREALSQWDSQMRQRVLPGKIQWFLGDCGETYLSGECTLA